MQAVALVTGDEFLADFNLTIDTADVLEYMGNLTWNWRKISLPLIDFDDQYGIEFAQIVTPSGVCENFNLILANDLLNTKKLPKSFNFTKARYLQSQIMKYRIRTMNPNKPYPLNVSEYRSGFSSVLQKTYHKRPMDINHHEKFNYQGINYFIHSPYEMISRETAVHQSIVNHSMIVYLNPQKTIIDKALEKYSSERFELLFTWSDFHSFHNTFRRGCYLKEEKPLKFFKIYTENNCRSECLANKTLTVCGCAQFYMVREVSTRVCGVADMKCYKNVEAGSQSQDWCQCYLECGEIVYKTEQQQNDFVQ
jgi:acid-sensing ion channel, other